ncbi:hypothetical protein JVT61DRAFT_5309 [Boletus reticuloceps]|uniref:Uncharacterized protein n=1 Tax=Boletus reticuloceps TaxID=495285 RepID=A0A8I2Z232_9AGAM|nr:hypothetical protein JVT61DRAFT_5309 [Boletus reticuloceps]
MTQKRRPTAAAQRDARFSTPIREEQETGSSSAPNLSDTVLQRLTTPSLTAKYAGVAVPTQNLEFKSRNSGDILVVKQGDEEFILRGVFQVARNDFFLTPDGSFNPANALGTRFQDVKLNCHLTVPSPNTFPFAVTDYPTCIENLRMLERIVKHDKKDETLSTLSGSLKRRFSSDSPSAPNDNEEPKANKIDSETLESASDEGLGEEFAMETWPVAPRCVDVLKEILATHDLCPLPAYDKKGRLIPPTQYEAMLKGAMVEAHFALIHHYIKSSKRHIYVAMVRKLQILCSPPPMPTSPFKRLRVSADKGSKKGKGREV